MARRDLSLSIAVLEQRWRSFNVRLARSTFGRVPRPAGALKDAFRAIGQGFEGTASDWTELEPQVREICILRNMFSISYNSRNAI